MSTFAEAVERMIASQKVQSPGLKAALANLGTQSNPQEPLIQCENCHDLGLFKYADLPIDHPWFGKLFACPNCQKGQEMLTNRWKKQLKNAQLPPLYQRFNFGTWDDLPATFKQGKQLAYQAALMFVRNENQQVDLGEASRLAGRDLGGSLIRNSLIFQGGMGIGKTGLAAAIVNERAINSQATLYIRAQDLLDSIQDRIKKPDELPTPHDVVQNVAQAPVLVIDEFNVSKVGEWLQGQVETVIRHRHANELPTILTCNATREELTAQWGVRTTHVLFSMAHWIPMAGEVLRDLRQIDEAF